MQGNKYLYFITPGLTDLWSRTFQDHILLRHRSCHDQLIYLTSPKTRTPFRRGNGWSKLPHQSIQGPAKIPKSLCADRLAKCPKCHQNSIPSQNKQALQSTNSSPSQGWTDVCCAKCPSGNPKSLRMVSRLPFRTKHMPTMTTRLAA